VRHGQGAGGQIADRELGASRATLLGGFRGGTQLYGCLPPLTLRSLIRAHPHRVAGHPCDAVAGQASLGGATVSGITRDILKIAEPPTRLPLVGMPSPLDLMTARSSWSQYPGTQPCLGGQRCLDLTAWSGERGGSKLWVRTWPTALHLAGGGSSLALPRGFAPRRCEPPNTGPRQNRSA